ncbi:MAG: DUF222 domain-containing protein [Actinomycetota bacterium]|nr:DUF222 domain-containing protein [Actinomycetota bacterium]
MCESLEALCKAVVGFAVGFDAAAISPAVAGVVVERCTSMEASISAVKVLAAARMAESDSWKREGCRSPAEQLGRKARMSPSAARRALETGRRLARQPEVAQAALGGELSSAQAEAVSDGVAADGSKAGELLDAARSSTIGELNEQVAQVKAAATDAEEAHRRLQAKRSLRRWVDRDGAWQSHATGLPEDGVRLWRVLDPMRRRLNLLHRRSGVEPESLEALDYDALMTLAAVAAGGEAELSFADLRELGLFPQFDEPDVGSASAAESYQAESCAADEPGPVADPPIAAGSQMRVATDCDGEGADGQGSDRQGADGAPGEGFVGVPGATTSGIAGASAVSDPDPPTAPAPPQDAGRAPDPVASGGPGCRSEDAVAEIGGARDLPGTGVSGAPKAKRLAGSPMQIMVRVDLDALLRGVALEGELCEIAGWGPVPVSVIERLAASENPFLVGVLTKGTEVVGVYHHRRRPNSVQRSALDFVQPTCQVKGCPVRAGLQYDHREDWSRTKFTVYDLLDRLCPHHHRLKTERGWALVEGVGKRLFVPPDDGRHPRHGHPAPSVPRWAPPPTSFPAPPPTSPIDSSDAEQSGDAGSRLDELYGRARGATRASVAELAKNPEVGPS